MQCDQCAKEFPSRYYFKVDGVCFECYEKMAPEAQQAALSRALMKHPMTSTTFNLEGFRVVTHLGVVRGITVRSRSIFGTIGAGLQTIVGGNITMFTELAEKSRDEAFEMMIQHAEQIGANAVIGIRYDTTEMMDGVNEVLCYGTAVIVQPL